MKERTMKTNAASKLAAAMLAAGVSMEALAAALEEAKAGAGGTKAPRAISTQAQAEAIGAGVHPVKNAVGLYLKKGAPGAGSWVRRYRFGGRRRWIGLGPLKDVTLAEARRRADELSVQRAAGRDPLALKRAAQIATADAARAEGLAADQWDFEKATEEYLKAHAPSWKHPRARQVWHSPIVKYAYPVIGRMKLDDIRVEHVDAAMSAAVAGGAPAVAPRIRLRIEQILNAATALGKRDAARQNPASVKLIKSVRPTKDDEKGENFRRIALDKAPGAFQRLVTLAANSTPLSALVFMIATAARPSEALGAKWSEIDLAKRLWTVPKERMKGAKPHAVPLSDIALDVLTRQATVRCSDAVFPGMGGSPISYGAFSAAARGLGFDVGTPHSWRSVFRDTVEDTLGFPPHVAEAALAHSLGKVTSAYRRETGVEQRRGLMDAYARWLLGEDAGNVVEFKARA
jgi:integrase